jgi:acyl carrier protein
MTSPPIKVSGIDHDAVSRQVIEIVARALDQDPAKVHLDSRLWGDLGAESLDMLDIAFSLESNFKIRVPHSDLLGRARDHFGESRIVLNGVLSDFALELIRRSMPELDATQIRSGLTPYEFRRLVTVESLVRVVLRLLECKSQQVCPVCSGQFTDSEAAPELQCIQCGFTQPYPSGEQIFMDDLTTVGSRIEPPNSLSNGSVPHDAK